MLELEVMMQVMVGLVCNLKLRKDSLNLKGSYLRQVWLTSNLEPSSSSNNNLLTSSLLKENTVLLLMDSNHKDRYMGSLSRAQDQLQVLEHLQISLARWEWEG